MDTCTLTWSFDLFLRRVSMAELPRTVNEKETHPRCCALILTLFFKPTL